MCLDGKRSFLFIGVVYINLQYSIIFDVLKFYHSNYVLCIVDISCITYKIYQVALLHYYYYFVIYERHLKVIILIYH